MNNRLCQNQHRPRRHRPGVAAFTLVEVMVAAVIGAMIMGAVMTTYLISIKGFRAISHYVEIHGDGRKAIDRFARDMRGVNSITSCTSSSLVVVIPTAFSSTGSVVSNKTVSYTLNNGEMWRTDYGTGESRPLAHNIYQLTFSLYDRLGSSTTVLSTAKGVQIQIRLRKSVMSQIQSEDYLSARLDMRNVP